NAQNYIGLEPNKWLVQDGLRYELGDSLIALRKPLFLFDTGLDDLDSNMRFDYVIA
ncbi:MAG: class I SAM-dependent methyltransferase, partial [Proteobacteria bacterium]|nr:class I SAM-dependent methyltransferase [Pseudomonadota bacterium]